MTLKVHHYFTDTLYRINVLASYHYEINDSKSAPLFYGHTVRLMKGCAGKQMKLKKLAYFLILTF